MLIKLKYRKNVQDNPYILAGLDHQQIPIYNLFNNLPISKDILIDNIKKNLQLFEDFPELVKNYL